MPQFCGLSSFMMRIIKNVILMVCLLFPCAAWAGDALVNSEVEVDANGKDAADARSQAMGKAQTDALAELLGKLTTPEQVRDIITNLDNEKISGMVRGTEVLEEKMSSNRYRARLMVTFDGDQISALIGKGRVAGGGDAPAVTGSFLVIPAYEEDGSSILWDESNPWLGAWRNVGLETTTGDIVVPFGDSNDSALIDLKTLASANYATLAPLTVRYGVSDIVILQAKFTKVPDMVLTITKHRMNRTQNEVNLLTFRADPQETKDMLMIRAARDIVENLQHKKTEELETVKLIHGGDRNSVMMIATVSTLASWTQLRAKLSTLPMIDRLETLAISPQQVDIIVHYRGSPDSLANAITAQNLRLVKNEKYWVVSRD